MGKKYNNLIPTTAGFNYAAQQPLDDRDVVQRYSDLAELVSSNISYEGMEVYVVDDKKSYTLINNEWVAKATEEYVNKNSTMKHSKGENSAISGSSTNNFDEIVIPEKVYYKPIIEDYAEYIKTGKTFSGGKMYTPTYVEGDGDNIYPSDYLSIGDICIITACYYADDSCETYTDTFSFYAKVTELMDADGHDIYDEETGEVIGWEQSTNGYVCFEAISEYPDRPEGMTSIPPLPQWTIEVVKLYTKFENLTFTTNIEDTLLETLYKYTDKWGNKCYTVFSDYSPDIADGTTNDKNGNPLTSEVTPVEETDDMLTAIRYEALFNEGTYFAVADGDNSIASGSDVVAAGDDSVSMGYLNITLGDGSTAIGRKLLVRGVGASAFGLTGKATGRYAMAFNEGGQAIGYASLAFGDHCNALGYYDVAGGFYSTAKGHTSFAFGRYAEASALGAIAFGQDTKAAGRWCLVGGNKNECTGVGSLVYGLLNNVSGNYNLVTGQSNTVTGESSLVGGLRNTVSAAEGLVVGNSNTLEGNYGSAVFGNGNTVTGKNGSVSIGMGNTVSGERSFTAGQNNNVASDDSIVGGSTNEVSGKQSLVIGSNNKLEARYSIVCGSNNSETATSYSIIGGTGNKITGYYNMIIGSNHNVSGQSNIVGGAANDVYGHRGLAIGSNNDLYGSWGSAIFGNNNEVNGNQGAIASGQNNKVDADVSFAFGVGNKMRAYRSVAFGGENTVESGAKASIVVGEYNNTNYKYTSLFGYRVTADAPNQAVFGQYNEPRNDALFILGNGTYSEKHNVMTVTNTGKIECDDGLDVSKPGEGVILTSPNGTKFKLTVNDDGTLVTEGV